ncbi:MAG: O-antigen ligase family protein [Agathobacter sp.]|nr:O-antigen ligase family protein [Agathobacter sp.]
MSKLDFKQKIIVIFFLGLPFVDLLTSLSTRFIDFPITIGIVVRGLSLAISVVYVFLYTKCKYKKHTILYIGAIAVFAILYFLTKPDIWQLSSLVTEVIAAFKYLYFPIMLLCLYNIFQDFHIEADTIKRIISINCFVYAAMMLIPYFTGTGFSSYEWSFEGTTGWFYAANEIGPILIVLSICMLDLMDNNKKWKVLLCLPIIYSVSIIGTKVSYIGIIASVIIACLIFILKTKKNRFVLPAALLAILILCNFGSVAVENMGTLADLDKLPPSSEVETETLPEEDYPIDKVPQTTVSLIQGNKLLYLANRVTSNRVLYFFENWKPYTSNGVSTILFGFGWAERPALNNMYYKTLVEIDIFDILLHYGVIGFLIYFAPFVFLVYKFFCKLKYIRMESYAYILTVILGVGISCIAGHILGAPAVSIYLILLLLLVVQQTESHPAYRKGDDSSNDKL